MYKEGFYMDKMNIEDLENVAGGLTEEEQRLAEQARKDQEDFADYGDDLFPHSKKYKGSLASAAARKALAESKKK